MSSKRNLESDVSDTEPLPDIQLDDDQSDAGELEEYEKNKILVYRKKDLSTIEADYDSDSSTDEVLNTIGNVPIEWYDEYDHIGYDINGNKISRKKGDDIDKFLEMMDKDGWKTVHDKLEGKDIVLSKDELELLKRIQQHKFPETEIDPYEPTVEWFTSQTSIMPLSAAPEPKSRFVPSKWEASKIMKIARAIKAGYIQTGRRKNVKPAPTYYDIWQDEQEVDRTNHIPAPKMSLPEHMESYNPPEEYLLTEKELEEYNALDPEDRPHNFVPRKFDALRRVPLYNRFIQERFERCLDLYLCPRTIKNKLDIDPESLIPKLPSPKDLEPYPSKISITFTGHTERIRCMDIDPSGQFIASGSDDKTVRVWEIRTGRLLKSIQTDDKVYSVQWNPNKQVSLLAYACGSSVHLVSPVKTTVDVEEQTKTLIHDTLSRVEKSTFEWSKGKKSLLQIQLKKTITQIAWHRRGDYFATVSPDATASSVVIHQLSRAHSQAPFKKSPGQVQKAIFHPLKPLLFVATQRSVRIYNLSKQELVKKLMPGSQWISSLDVHPQAGDNVIVGTYDKKLHWFDMDLSAKPYKTMRYHTAAVRQVHYHKRYPLFCSSSDDGNCLVFHGMVYADLMQNPLIVPLKKLSGHEVVDNLGVLDMQFHPTQPWVFTCGADKTIKLW
ncbi:NUC169 domain-containing protein, partial [Gorgonomyces haynaldii]